MILSRLIQMVRVRAMIVGSDEFTPTIIELINESLTKFTARYRYPELFMPGTSVTTTAATGSISLPSDLQHLDVKSVRFQTTGSTTTDVFLRFRNRFNVGTEGSPTQFYRSGSTLVFNPYTSVTGVDEIVFDYWRRHTPLIGDSDTFPIADLENCVITDVASQMAMYNGREDAQRLSLMLSQKSAEDYSASFAISGRDQKL